MSSQGSRNYNRATRALLWSRSGGLCGFPECNVVCVEDAKDGGTSAVIGEIAHIEANSDAGPRANPQLSDQERNDYPNLILLCPTHHKTVDTHETTYTVDALRGWKTDRENKFRDFLAREMQNITFAELEAITQALVNNGTTTSDSLSLIPPREKIDRNGLTAPTETLFSIGLVQSKQVQRFVEVMGGLDRTFIARLTSGFVNEYQWNVQGGLQGDPLFEAMRRFSAQGRSDIRYQCAGLAVLVYLFERCDVFEQ